MLRLRLKFSEGINMGNEIFRIASLVGLRFWIGESRYGDSEYQTDWPIGMEYSTEQMNNWLDAHKGRSGGLLTLQHWDFKM